LLKKVAADAAAMGDKVVFGQPAPDKPAGEDAPPRPPHDATLKQKMGWLLETQAYCRFTDTVVDIFEPGMECQSTLKATQTAFAAWSEPDIGVNGRILKSRTSAFTMWTISPERLDVAGVRMHPGQPFPLYVESERIWKNIYRRPRHVGDGEIAPFLRFMNRFLPNVVEREWLFNWMAHKWFMPEMPGTCVLFVADDDDEDVREGKYGTGRGLLFKVAHKLYGPAYARSQSFTILDGSSGQSVYNDWLHGSVLVTIDESRTSPTAHRRGERKGAYEILKDFVDPSPKGFRFYPKYGKPFDGWSYCSMWLASNHDDAIAIPRTDRRFTVLKNGRIMEQEEIKEFVAWSADPGNIAALARFLEARKLGEFNMQKPLYTTAKEDMAEVSKSKVEDVMVELMNDDTRGLVFTRQQLEHAVEDIVNPVERLRGGLERRRGGSQWQGEFAGAWRDYTMSLKTETHSPCRVRIDGRQVKLYCFRKRRAEAAKLNDGTRRTEAGKWSTIDTLRDSLQVLKGGIGTQEKDEPDQ
jgi:hypothetical protein